MKEPKPRVVRRDSPRNETAGAWFPLVGVLVKALYFTRSKELSKPRESVCNGSCGRCGRCGRREREGSRGGGGGEQARAVARNQACLVQDDGWFLEYFSETWWLRVKTKDSGEIKKS